MSKEIDRLNRERGLALQMIVWIALGPFLAIGVMSVLGLLLLVFGVTL